jgi:hypothetical protein
MYLFRAILKASTDYFRKELQKTSACKGDGICFCKVEIERLYIML